MTRHVAPPPYLWSQASHSGVVTVPEFSFVDLFAGIGGFHLAMAQMGGTCVWASEIDEDAAQVYAKNFGFTPEGNIAEFTQHQDPFRAIPAHDVLCAGFPCQPFSKSGFQRGIHETRGTLFFDILKVLEAHRPRFAILENVRNLAGPRQRTTWETIIRQLRALGYRVASEPAVFSPHLLPPERDGRPQVRDRVFILCEYVGEEASDDDLRGPVLVDRQPLGDWDPHAWRIEEYLQEESEILEPGAYGLRQDECEWIEAWNAFVQRIDSDQLPGFPIWVDAFTPEPSIPPGTPRWKANFLRKNSDFYVQHQATIDQWLEDFPVHEFPNSRRKLEWQARSFQPEARTRDLWKLVLHMRPSGIRVKPPTYLPALVAITQTSIVGTRKRKITPREAARLQGFPDDFQLHENDAAAYKQLGNAVNVGAVKHVAEALFSASEAGWPDAT